MYLPERQQGSGSLRRGQFASRIAFQTPVLRLHIFMSIAKLCDLCRGIIGMLPWSVCIAFRTTVQ